MKGIQNFYKFLRPRLHLGLAGDLEPEPKPGAGVDQKTGFATLFLIRLGYFLLCCFSGANIQVSESYLERLSDAAMETYAMVSCLSR